MLNVVNLTPHTITIVINASETSITSSGLARVEAMPGCPLTEPWLFTAPVWGEVIGLPDPQADTIFIVSAIVAARCEGREDVFSPGTGPQDGAIRDAKGQIKAVTRLIQAPQKSQKCPVCEGSGGLGNNPPCWTCGQGT